MSNESILKPINKLDVVLNDKAYSSFDSSDCDKSNMVL